MLHIVFFLINFIALGVLLIIDRRGWKAYALLSLLTLVAAFFFENVSTLLGFWSYASSPMLWEISLYTWLLYSPYICFCYFIATRGAQGV